MDGMARELEIKKDDAGEEHLKKLLSGFVRALIIEVEAEAAEPIDEA